MSTSRELQARRSAALAVVRAVPREEVRGVLDMLGLIPLDPPRLISEINSDLGGQGRAYVGRTPRRARAGAE